jgi:hypothetical protein
MIFAIARQIPPLPHKNPCFPGIFVFLGRIGANRRTAAAPDFAPRLRRIPCRFDCPAYAGIDGGLAAALLDARPAEVGRPPLDRRQRIVEDESKQDCGEQVLRGFMDCP